VARPRPFRLSNGRILRELRAAARKGDRAALTLALEQMRILALSPRYWKKYLGLLANPLARLVDLLVIKQGERIAHQKGWKLPGGGLRAVGAGLGGPFRNLSQESLRGRSPRSKRKHPPRRPGGRSPERARPRRPPPGGAQQQVLFELPPRA
jgi:hypothetical protein